MSIDELEHWNGKRRADGVFVVPVDEDRFIAIHPNGYSLHRCSCCRKPFATERNAQHAADHCWPVVTLDPFGDS
jgi:hypothetical protein